MEKNLARLRKTVRSVFSVLRFPKKYVLMHVDSERHLIEWPTLMKLSMKEHQNQIRGDEIHRILLCVFPYRFGLIGCSGLDS